MLHVEGLNAWYGKSHILHGVDFQVAPGQIVALLGRNGSGRSTVARALMGLVESRGRIEWQGHSLHGLPTHRVARLGLGYVPESRDVFPRLTVLQNLILGQAPGRRAPAPGDWSRDEVLHLFPRLAERRDTPAGVLSGGEQQMLALARSLLGNPGLMIVDEPTEGLAPQLIERVAQVLALLRRRGTAVLLIEQKLAIALDLADSCLVMGHGRIVHAGTAAELLDSADIRREWLEV